MDSLVSGHFVTPPGDSNPEQIVSHPKVWMKRLYDVLNVLLKCVECLVFAGVCLCDVCAACILAIIFVMLSGPTADQNQPLNIRNKDFIPDTCYLFIKNCH